MGIYALRCGYWVRRLREERGQTQAQLSERASVSLSVLKTIESGRGNPRLDTLVSLAEALGTEPLMLLRAEDSPGATSH